LPEQITDRAIKVREQDLLGHEDYVERLLTIVGSTETPANIALFGRWGSGKTGISNRLVDEVRDLDGFRFAYFDAFKYARLPLLRRFLVRLAEELGGEAKAKRVRRQIYERQERVHLDKRHRLKALLIHWSALALLALAVSIWIFDLLAIFVLDSEQLRVMTSLIGAVFPVVLPSSLLAAVAVFTVRYLSVTTTTETPSSDEQFEEIFRKLLEDENIGCGPDRERLVVFVDELDRCSAVEVARTLESIKTFLGEDGCIFIVAADRMVLEHALTQRVRQATPRDLANPYYSAGSAYLDKIFQYQIALPPLFPGRLTDFALRLLREAGGVWDQVDSKEDVVSVLLPVTVRSPRRVKVLLNTFAQAYALALSRARSKVLDDQVRARASEMAKLVALQVEFPLFAADLHITPDLPAVVLACVEARAEGNDPSRARRLQGVPKSVADRAIEYSEGKLPTDETLNRGPDADAEMTVAQGMDLLDYLQQTRLISGPGADLIHLEGLGVSAGLDESLAIEISDLALKNRPVLLAELLEAMTDQGERERAILFLRDLVRSSRGNDADNALRAYLLAFPLAKGAITSVAPDLLAAIRRLDRKRTLQSDELPAALDLAILGRYRGLMGSILRRPEAEFEPLRGVVLDRAEALAGEYAERLGQLLLAEMIEDPAAAGRRLSG